MGYIWVSLPVSQLLTSTAEPLMGATLCDSREAGLEGSPCTLRPTRMSSSGCDSGAVRQLPCPLSMESRLCKNDFQEVTIEPEQYYFVKFHAHAQGAYQMLNTLIYVWIYHNKDICATSTFRSKVSQPAASC